MKPPLIITAILLLTLAGCSSAPNSSAAPRASVSQNQPSDNSTFAAAPASPQTGDAVPAPPQGALYTIHCAVFTGPTHIADAKRMKDSLIQATRSTQWYVIHGEDESDLYFGYYKTFEDQSQVAEYARAQTDRARVSSLVDDEGQPLFPQIAFTSINLPDPPAPPQWELSHNPGYWTLQIAVYRGSTQRKQAAVDAVRAFREHGIEAYFRHGQGTSEVYIGSFPRSAVAEQDDSVAKSDDADQSLLVLPGALPSGIDPDHVYDNSGRKVKVIMPKLVIVDPKLKMTAQQYPYYYVNGEVAGRKVQLPDHTWKTVPWSSYLIQVPHDDQTADSGEADQSNLGSPPADNPTDQTPGGGSDTGAAPTTPSVPGLGGLR